MHQRSVKLAIFALFLHIALHYDKLYRLLRGGGVYGTLFCRKWPFRKGMIKGAGGGHIFG